MGTVLKTAKPYQDRNVQTRAVSSKSHAKTFTTQAASGSRGTQHLIMLIDLSPAVMTERV